ncbi:hypothetical protein A3195_09855 [Candidatus Thiodiazotropha endoloripes]|uniref:Uncharacterized protein n=1 Tax=Candidatus Thiodiazotropha endoloripes TaxID=1818881 RepID=A0A1E2UQS7_9GAMM|nr:hypothetical protein A3195_09855 [Candidatus Thiodiazotropha endoloripes]ODB97087.1 hypothetical protein A3196_10105 [Candidatus Thiodiazotropha endoloripes]
MLYVLRTYSIYYRVSQEFTLKLVLLIIELDKIASLAYPFVLRTKGYANDLKNHFLTSIRVESAD